MTRPRATLVCAEETPFYHCVGRCVRRAFLCGSDQITGRSFEHRRVWMRERLTVLTEVFAVDICAYALMSNHYHLVVKLCVARTLDWTEREVIERWTQLFAGPPVAHRYLENQVLTRSEQAQLRRFTTLWRERLGNLSWFMRCLNEHIARRANHEDACTGHFWESRFKSQALLDETAVLTAMAYVDLNPVRAGMALGIPDSEHTSGQDRWCEISESDNSPASPALLPFVGAQRANSADGLPFNIQDYLDLIDTTGRCIRDDKSGYISNTQPKLLSVLGVEPGEWFKTVTELQTRYELAVGAPERLRQFARRWGKHWVSGLGHARRLYSMASG